MVSPLLKIGDKSKNPVWVRYIKNRIKKKKNFLCLVSGPTGSGKSWACLSIALMLDKTFGPDRILFSLSDLMKLINSGKKYPAGIVAMWDEFQIGAGNRDWQSLTNKLLNSLLTTFRHKNIILLINAPYSDFIDSASKKLLHAEWTTKSIDFKNKQTILKPFALQYNSSNKKFYPKYLKVKGPRGIDKLKRWRIDKPPKWIIDEYETRKEAFTSKLNRSIQDQLEALEGKESTKKAMTEMQEKVLNLMEKHGDSQKVAEILEISPRSIRFHIAQARKKGHIVVKGDELEV